MPVKADVVCAQSHLMERCNYLRTYVRSCLAPGAKLGIYLRPVVCVLCFSPGSLLCARRWGCVCNVQMYGRELLRS